MTSWIDAYPKVEFGGVTWNARFEREFDLVGDNPFRHVLGGEHFGPHQVAWSEACDSEQSKRSAASADEYCGRPTPPFTGHGIWSLAAGMLLLVGFDQDADGLIWREIFGERPSPIKADWWSGNVTISESFESASPSQSFFIREGSIELATGWPTDEPPSSLRDIPHIMSLFREFESQTATFLSFAKGGSVMKELSGNREFVNGVLARHHHLAQRLTISWTAAQKRRFLSQGPGIKLMPMPLRKIKATDIDCYLEHGGYDLSLFHWIKPTTEQLVRAHFNKPPPDINKPPPHIETTYDSPEQVINAMNADMYSYLSLEPELKRIFAAQYFKAGGEPRDIPKDARVGEVAMMMVTEDPSNVRYLPDSCDNREAFNYVAKDKRYYGFLPAYFKDVDSTHWPSFLEEYPERFDDVSPRKIRPNDIDRAIKAFAEGYGKPHIRRRCDLSRVPLRYRSARVCTYFVQLNGKNIKHLPANLTGYRSFLAGALADSVDCSEELYQILEDLLDPPGELKMFHLMNNVEDLPSKFWNSEGPHELSSGDFEGELSRILDDYGFVLQNVQLDDKGIEAYSRACESRERWARESVR